MTVEILKVQNLTDETGSPLDLGGTTHIAKIKATAILPMTATDAANYPHDKALQQTVRDELIRAIEHLCA